MGIGFWKNALVDKFFLFPFKMTCIILGQLFKATMYQQAHDRLCAVPSVYSYFKPTTNL